MPYPTDLAGRVARRREIRQRLIAEAERKTRQLSRTITCAEYVDHSTCVGASVCLCECHDPEGS